MISKEQCTDWTNFTRSLKSNVHKRKWTLCKLTGILVASVSAPVPRTISYRERYFSVSKFPFLYPWCGKIDDVKDSLPLGPVTKRFVINCDCFNDDSDWIMVGLFYNMCMQQCFRLPIAVSHFMANLCVTGPRIISWGDLN